MKKNNNTNFAYVLLVLIASCTKSEDLLIPKSEPTYENYNNTSTSNLRADTPYKAVDTPYRKINFNYKTADTPYKVVDTPYRKFNVTYKSIDTPYKFVDTPYRYLQKKSNKN